MKITLENKKYKGIYCIENTINKHRYIGSSVDIYTRLHRHKSDILRNKHANCILQNAFNKNGFDSFICYIIEEIQDESQLTLREQYWIDTLNPKYNITRDVVRNVLSMKSRLKISKTLKRKYKSGEINLTKTTPVCVYNLDGIKIATFNTIKDCAHTLGINNTSIIRVIDGTMSKCFNFRFKRKDDNLEIISKYVKPERNYANYLGNSKGKKVFVFDMNNNFIKECASVDAASRFTKITSRIIGRRILDNIIRKNDTFIFKNKIN